MVGPIINSVAVVTGSVCGAGLGGRLPERLRVAMPLSFGIAAMGIGITLIVKISTLPPVVIAFLFGSAFGELVCLERIIGSFAAHARRLVERFAPHDGSVSHEVFIDRFVALIVLFCASGMGVFGSINEGVNGDFSILITKSILDIFTALIFAASLGYSVALIAVPQFLIQFSLFLGGDFIAPLTSPSMIGDFSACGGLIMIATGLRMTGIKGFPIANMLPALVLVMPISWLWSLVF